MLGREEIQDNLEAIKHFAGGGSLWCKGTSWNKQYGVITKDDNLCLDAINIIEDCHFEARKAFALGAELEVRSSDPDVWFPSSSPSFNHLWEYRIKNEESVYEYQWYRKCSDGTCVLTTQRHTKEVIEKDKWGRDWYKFEPSKRLVNAI